MAGPGQNSGHARSGRALDWDSDLHGLVAEHGSLASVAEALARTRWHRESVESIARALRRLRTRTTGDGGVWGQRCLTRFGLPEHVCDRVRWMGQYHSRFTDLPATICAELLRPWDQPPVSASPVRVWLALGWTSLAIRRRDDRSARAHLDTAHALGARVESAAAVERALVSAYLSSRVDPEATATQLRIAARDIEVGDLHDDDRACLRARWVDQRAYPLNRPGAGIPRHTEALALYSDLPDDAPPFARCRKANGMAWTLQQLGRRDEARQWAERSVQDAGDAGSLRLRAMALAVLARLQAPDAAASTRTRARQIARHLEDDVLTHRFRDRSGSGGGVGEDGVGYKPGEPWLARLVVGGKAGIGDVHVGEAHVGIVAARVEPVVDELPVLLCESHGHIGLGRGSTGKGRGKVGFEGLLGCRISSPRFGRPVARASVGHLPGAGVSPALGGFRGVDVRLEAVEEGVCMRLFGGHGELLVEQGCERVAERPGTGELGVEAGEVGLECGHAVEGRVVEEGSDVMEGDACVAVQEHELESLELGTSIQAVPGVGPSARMEQADGVVVVQSPDGDPGQAGQCTRRPGLVGRGRRGHDNLHAQCAP